MADSPAVAAACELVIAGDPAGWARLGFAPDAAGVIALGPLAIRLAGRAAGDGIVALALDGEAPGDADGLPLTSCRPGAHAAAAAHPNGAVAIDHVVVFTDSRDRTAAALVRAGGDERRRGGPPGLPAPMAFVRFGALIVEVAEAPGQRAARFWGVTVTTTDIDAAAALAGRPPRDAVQPGRRILTVPREAGLSTALALITPRPSPPAPAARA